ncbi:MAG: hypothetical protein A2505_06475 [Deltaproteobacteria bacterium RIFOXYD12_FULL_55_16]|nr:MAG: hypothetical protein A2505_06475 [Deltaproteobacteria bacterium RIFOXYD12_FULL_55_16]
MGLFHKQLLYLTNDQLTACRWKNGSPSHLQIFPNDESGWADFSRQLAKSPGTPTWFLADLIEEDFQRTTLPHVLGSSRLALIQRHLDQLYRDTPYRHATLQGREDQGRKDDRMLFSALTNAELLKPWLSEILKQKIPLVGIYSPALLSALLIKKLALVSDNLLLVTHQSNGLRQSFLQGSELKFSRLTSLSDHTPYTVANTAASEATNTQHFLANSRLLPRGTTLEVVILAHDKLLPQIKSASRDVPDINYRFIDLAEAAARLGLKNPGSVTLCDSLFLFLLNHAGSNQYAPKEQTRFFRLRQGRHLLYLLSVCFITGGLLWTGANSLETMRHYQQNRQIDREAREAEAQYQAIAHRLPTTAATPQRMSAAVTIEQMLSRNAAAPAQLLGIVSRALETLPQISLDRLHWQVETEPEAEQASPGTVGDQKATPSATLIGIPKKSKQVLLLEGEVTPFTHDYRSALKSVRLFAIELGKNKQLKVEITSVPLDIAPTTKLTGKAGHEDPDSKARFSLKLTLSPES